MKGKRIVIMVLIIAIIAIAGCAPKYICFDGSEQRNPQKCPKLPICPVIEERDARDAVDNYGLAYARAKGDLFTRVNLYAANTSYWTSDVIFTNTKTGSINEVRLKIDGKSASISCISGCQYLVSNTSQ